MRNPTLDDLGIDKKTSMIAQALHRLPVKLLRRIAARQVSIVKAIYEHRQRTAERPRLPKGKFRVIYADPAWKFGSPGFRASGAKHYAVMTVDEIAAMDVKALAADDAVLFLWTTAPLILQMGKVIESWGFSYSTNIVWNKELGCRGHFTQVQHEILLICTRGHCPPDRLLPMVRSVQTIRRSKRHSAKPHEFYKIIEGMYDGPYIELFARNRRAGWASFGNQLDSAA